MNIYYCVCKHTFADPTKHKKTLNKKDKNKNTCQNLLGNFNDNKRMRFLCCAVIVISHKHNLPKQNLLKEKPKGKPKKTNTHKEIIITQSH